MEPTLDRENIYLQMHLTKSLQQDEFGNVIFEVEASNENLDTADQRVLQRALMQTKDYFLKNGVISKDHKHRTFKKNGSFDIHEEYVIGEPIDVYTKGTSTIVKGKLFPNNEHAHNFIKLLEAGSSRVKASVGGLVPRVRKVIEDGQKEVGEIVSVLWDELALTITPVNPTVEPATSMAKSLTSVEFVKALSAGAGVDAAQFTGGRALQKEDVGYAQNLLVVNEKVIASLVGAISDGDVDGEDEAEAFLIDYGLSKSDACDIVQAVCRKSNIFMEVFPMAKTGKKSWTQVFQNLKKSLAGEPAENDDDPAESGGDPTNEGGDDDYVDATEVLEKALAKIETLEANSAVMAEALTTLLEKQGETAAMQKSLGEGILAIMERTEEVIASPNQRKGMVTPLEAALAKSLGAGGGNAAAGAGGGLRPFTQARMDIAKDVLSDAVSKGEITIKQLSRFETHMNKSLGMAAYAFPEDMVEFFKKKMSA